jgi:hypothetical protein
MHHILEKKTEKLDKLSIFSVISTTKMHHILEKKMEKLDNFNYQIFNVHFHHRYVPYTGRKD